MAAAGGDESVSVVIAISLAQERNRSPKSGTMSQSAPPPSSNPCRRLMPDSRVLPAKLTARNSTPSGRTGAPLRITPAIGAAAISDIWALCLAWPVRLIRITVPVR